jgi:hypothetical protein
MEEKCASAAICFVSFLPDILDSKAEGRNKYLEFLLSIAEKFKKSPYRQGSQTNYVGLTIFFFYGFENRKQSQQLKINTSVPFIGFAKEKSEYYHLAFHSVYFKY